MVKKAILEGAETTKQLDMSVFDLTIARDILLATLLAFGAFFGLRGGSEHCNLLLSNIAKGVFGSNHELAGQECYQLQHINTKTNKLSMCNPTLKNERDVRVPVNSPAGNAITAVLNGVGSGQICFYCYPVPRKQKRMLAKVGLGEVMFMARKPMRVNKICSMFKEATTRPGFEDTTGHAF